MFQQTGDVSKKSQKAMTSPQNFVKIMSAKFDFYVPKCQMNSGRYGPIFYESNPVSYKWTDVFLSKSLQPAAKQNPPILYACVNLNPFSGLVEAWR